MATKKSVFLSDSTANWIASTTKSAEDTPKWSESINATVDQLRFLLKTSFPELTQDEWQVILNTYAGCYMPGHSVPARIASDIMDDMGQVDVNSLPDDRRDLVLKLHKMTQTEQLAILYAVQMFWSQNWNDYVDFNAIIAEIKNKF